jgi:Ni/Co efflux regulator RcnB
MELAFDSISSATTAMSRLTLTSIGRRADADIPRKWRNERRMNAGRCASPEYKPNNPFHMQKYIGRKTRRMDERAAFDFVTARRSGQDQGWDALEGENDMKRILGSLVALSVLAGSTAGAFAADHPYTAQHSYSDSGHRSYNSHADYRRGQHVRRADWNRARPVDYRAYRLPPPARGYEWREVNGQFVEAAIVGGLIGAVIIAANH